METFQSPGILLASIFVLGVGAQWLSWKVGLPSILLLLTFGFVAGPVTQFLNPDKVFGTDLLLPLVSLAVAIILFEGSLTLRLHEWSKIGVPLRNMLSIGVVITWLSTTAAGHWILDMEWKTAFLLGAILTVTGPTVISPMLKYIRPTGKVGQIARWEGILVDPVGAVLAVLVFTGSTAYGEGTSEAVWLVAKALGLTIFVGGLLGFVGAWSLGLLLRRYLIPDNLHNPVVFASVLGVFAVSNAVQSESGLLAVTVMGFVLANQQSITIKHIVEFKENVTVLLIGSLFILLSARIQRDQLAEISLPMFGFVAVLMLVIRPAAIFLSTWRTGLNWKEQTFLSWLAPRGIVAAAVASVFALEAAGHGEAIPKLVPAVFLVIVITVAIYGLTAFPLARWLGLAQRNPQGILIASAHPGVRAIALVLQAADIPVILVDTNWGNIQTAKLEGLRARYASILSTETIEDMDLGGIGRFLALTYNDEVNSLAAWQLKELFGQKEVYQLVPRGKKTQQTKTDDHLLHGRLLFHPDETYESLDDRFARGQTAKKTRLTEEFDFEKFREYYGETALPLFAIDGSGNLTVFTAKEDVEPQPGHTLISLVDVPEKDKLTDAANGQQ